MSRKPVTCINCGEKMVWGQMGLNGAPFLYCITCFAQAPRLNRHMRLMGKPAILSTYRKIMRLVEKGRERV